MVEIDGARLLASLHELRTFGATGTGVVRPTFSDVDMAARRWLRDRMEAAGLDAHIDGVGNVIGRSPNPGPAVRTVTVRMKRPRRTSINRGRCRPPPPSTTGGA